MSGGREAPAHRLLTEAIDALGTAARAGAARAARVSRPRSPWTAATGPDAIEMRRHRYPWLVDPNYPPGYPGGSVPWHPRHRPSRRAPRPGRQSGMNTRSVRPDSRRPEAPRPVRMTDLDPRLLASDQLGRMALALIAVEHDEGLLLVVWVSNADPGHPLPHLGSRRAGPAPLVRHAPSTNSLRRPGLPHEPTLTRSHRLRRS
jgi:hypothetical protein